MLSYLVQLLFEYPMILESTHERLVNLTYDLCFLRWGSFNGFLAAISVVILSCPEVRTVIPVIISYAPQWFILQKRVSILANGQFTQLLLQKIVSLLKFSDELIFLFDLELQCLSSLLNRLVLNRFSLCSIGECG